MAKKTVVIEVDEPSPFGEEVDPELAEDPTRDIFYIEGYSDRRRARDLQVARGERPDPLPFRLQAVKAQSASGSPDGRRIAEWKAKGYRILTWRMADELGLNVKDSAAVKSEADAVQIGDQIIMVADARTAATHYKRNQDAIASQAEDLVRAPLRNAAEEYNRRMGREALGLGATDAEFEVEPQGDKKKS